jgi:hypothetical protein
MDLCSNSLSVLSSVTLAYALSEQWVSALFEQGVALFYNFCTVGAGSCIQHLRMPPDTNADLLHKGILMQPKKHT